MITGKRKKIKNANDIVNGCGLSVDAKPSFISTISNEAIFNLSQKTSIGCVKASIELDFWFEAGYSIKGDYIINAYGDAKKNGKTTNTIKDLVSIVKEAELEIEIPMDESYDLPFNNWTMLAHNNEVLKELLAISEDHRDIDLVTENHDLNESIIYTGENECAQVAYGLRDIINHKEMKYNTTGFTEAVVKKLHSSIKKMMIEALMESGFY